MMSSADIVAELRALADRIEAVPEVPEPPAPVLKSVMAGLLDRQGDVARAVKHGLSGVVISFTWADVAAKGWYEVKQKVEAARAAGLGVRLRPLAGVYAADWAKKEFGTFLADVDGKSGECWCWWKPGAPEAWRAFMGETAVEFDADPVIADVDLGGGCGIVAAEPFLRSGKRGPTSEAMQAAGFDWVADLDAIHESLDVLREWPTTRGYLACNPYQCIGDDGRLVVEVRMTTDLIRSGRESYGSQLVLGNDSIRWPLQEANGYAEMYDALIAAGKPLSFQTATPEKIGSWEATAGWAAHIAGASSVELPRSYPQWDAQKLAEFNAALIANAGVA